MPNPVRVSMSVTRVDIRLEFRFPSGFSIFRMATGADRRAAVQERGALSAQGG
jgi:hypothetical protein